MTSQEVDTYLASVDEPGRSTLEELRNSILDVVPEAEPCISYGLPAFKVEGKVVAGFGAFQRHLSYFPHSGSVFDQLGDELAGYSRTKSSLHFAADEPLPRALVKRLVEAKMRDVGLL